MKEESGSQQRETGRKSSDAERHMCPENPLQQLMLGWGAEDQPGLKLRRCLEHSPGENPRQKEKTEGRGPEREIEQDFGWRVNSQKCTFLHVLRCSVTSNSLQPHGPQPTRLLCPWNSPGKNTVGCHSLLQGIFPTQESNPCLFIPPALAGRFFTTNIA